MNELEAVRQKLREYMNHIAADMAGGGCEDFESYMRLVGKVEALALVERDVLDLEKLLQED